MQDSKSKKSPKINKPVLPEKPAPVAKPVQPKKPKRPTPPAKPITIEKPKTSVFQFVRTHRKKPLI